MADKYPRTSGWHRVNVTIAHGQVAADLTDYPVYLDLSLMPAEFWAAVIDGGGDIRITAADLETEVPREVVSCDTVGQTGEVHFKAAGTLSSSVDTIFVVHFGKAGEVDYAADDTYGAQAVWDSNYKLVLHMGDDPDTSHVQDSTVNNNDGTKYAAGQPVETTGAVGKAQSFDGSNDLISCGDNGMAITGDITVETYLKTPATWPVVTTTYRIADRTTGGLYGWDLHLTQASLETERKFGFTLRVSATWGDDFAKSTEPALAASWYHVAGIRSGSSVKIMVNGLLKHTDAGTAGNILYGSGTIYNYIGMRYGASVNPYWKGLIDEVRISSVARSEHWIATGYNNLSNPGTFSELEGYLPPCITGLQATCSQVGELVGGQDVINIVGGVPTQSNHSVRPGFGLAAVFPESIGLGLASGFFLPSGLGLSSLLAVSVWGLQGLEVVVAGLGAISSLAIYNGLGTNLRQLLINQISDEIKNIQAIKNILSGDAVQSLFSTSLTIAERDLLQGCQQILLSAAMPETSIHTISRDVYLDGRNITGLCSGVTIARSQDAIFNDVTITSNDADLYHRADPHSGRGTSRIEIHVAGEVFYFLLETRSGDAAGFTIWGRDITARESDMFAAAIEYSFEEPVTAGTAAADMATVAAVDWDCMDWLLPADFDYAGFPIDGISVLAAEIGGIVRAQADGSLLIRDKYPVRPVDLASAGAAVSYDQKDLIALKKQNVLQAIYDAVSVSSDKGLEAFIPGLELEEESPSIGDTVHIKVFWEGNANTTFSRYATSGGIVSEGMKTETITDEVVEFVNSRASAQYPVISLKKYDWIGDRAATINYTSGSREISIGDPGEQLFRVAKITYTVQYERLRLRGATVSQLLGVLFLDAMVSAGYLVNVVAGDSDTDPRYGDVINTSWLTSEPAARVRGQAWLDDNHYHYEDVSFEAPFDADSVDGAIVYLNDDLVGERGNYQIMSSNIVISGPKVVNQITARRWVTE